jgi:hypothetical protein
MLPAIAAHAIEHLSRPGDVVVDPMCGAGTSLVEAVHRGRCAVGVELEPRWAELARRNLRLAATLGARGTGRVVCADARGLPENLPEAWAAELRGRVRLVVTSPPYGPSTHGQVEVRPGAGVSKSDYRYSTHAREANLAYQPLPRLAAGLEVILTGCRALLAPDGYVVITARPWRRRGALIDLPEAVIAAAERSGLVLTQRCVALLAGLRDGGLVTRASFFQRDAVAKARAAGIPRQLICHEDTLIFQPELNPGARELTREVSLRRGGPPTHRTSHLPPVTERPATNPPPGGPLGRAHFPGPSELGIGAPPCVLTPAQRRLSPSPPRFAPTRAADER